MGHERAGVLPQSKQWREVVAQLGSVVESDDVLVDVAAKTLDNVRGRFERIHRDPGVQAAFGFLLGLSTSHLRTQVAGKASPPLQLSDNPSPLRLAAILDGWVQSYSRSLEYAEIAKRAAADAIAHWTRAQARQRDLFDPDIDAERVWRSASTGAAFCEISRVFFGKFVERYLKYFLEREASAQLPTIQERERFSQRLEEKIDALSHHAFETSEITQSFAAGWFNKHATAKKPSDEEIAGFLAFAFGKLRQELQREAAE